MSHCPSKVTFKSTNGLVYLKITVAGKADRAFAPKIFEVNSVSRAAELVTGDFRFTDEDRGLQMDFLKGSLDIPIRPLDPEGFDFELGDKKREATFEKESLIESIQQHKEIIKKAQVPELAALFLTEQGFYSSNGMIVARSSDTNIRAAIRYRDFPAIKSFIEWTLLSEEDMIIEVYSTAVRLVCGDNFLVVPRMQVTLPQNYRSQLDDFPRTHFYIIKPGVFLSTISVLKSMPQNAGTLRIHTGDGKIYGSSPSKQGKVSSFVISDRKEGLPTDFDFTMSLEMLSTAISLFRNDPIMCFSFIEEIPYLFTDEKAQAIVLKRS